MESFKTYRTAEAGTVSERSEGDIIRLLGWVSSKREHGGKVFLDLRDYTGYVQIVADESTCGSEVFQRVSAVTQESAVGVEGNVSQDPRAPGGAEVKLTDLIIISKADTWPITLSALESPGFLYEMRHLTIRGPTTRAIMKLRSELLTAAHQYFEERGYVWIQAPTFITSGSEGGATLFEVGYFGDTAYLTQSAQLYEEAAICSLERVYVIQPSFRSEKSRTRRHLTEFWHIEAEAAFVTHDDIMEVEEGLLHSMISRLLEEGQSELLQLEADWVEPPELPLRRIPYEETLEILERKGLSMSWGGDFGAKEERALSKEFEEPFFVTQYPVSARPFYQMPDPENEELTLSSDLFAPGGYGEITSGGQRIHDYDLLIKRLKEEDLDPKDYEWYVDLRRYGMPPHSGFGIGLERILRWVLRLPHIRAATMFPRTPDRIYP